jgi:hypothetical protein
VPTLLSALVTLLSSPPFFPPTPDALRAVRAFAQVVSSLSDDKAVQLCGTSHAADVVRSELLIAAFTSSRAQRRDGGTTNALLMQASLVARPTYELLIQVLRQVAEPPLGGAGYDAATVMTRVTPHVTPPLYNAWMKATTQLDRSSFLHQFDATRSGDRETHWRHLIDALRGIGPVRDRLTWLTDIAHYAPGSLTGDLVEVARGLATDEARLGGLAAVLYAMHGGDRKPVLSEALALAARVSGLPNVVHDLVNMAIDTDPTDTALMAAATAAGVTLGDKALRASAFTNLAKYLPPDELAAASRAFRTIGDTAVRVRAMASLATSIVDVAVRERTSEEMAASIDRLPSGHTRNAALLVIAPLLPEGRRWSALSAALTGGTGGATGFNTAELLEALSNAAPDAPARVMQQALTWLATQTADETRAHTVVTLLPFLPAWQLLPAVSLLAHTTPAMLACLEPFVHDDMFADAADNESHLPRDTKNLLEEIQKRRAAASHAAETSDPRERLLRVKTDRERANVVKTIALDQAQAVTLKSALVTLTCDIGDAQLRRATAAYLAPLCSEDSMSAAYQSAKLIQAPSDRALVKSALAARLAGSDRRGLLQEALADVRTEPAMLACAMAAGELAARCPELLKPLLDVVWSVADEDASACAMRYVIPRLDDRLASVAVETLVRAKTEGQRALILAAIANFVGPLSRRTALNVIAGLRSAVLRGRTLAVFAPSLKDEDKTTALSLLSSVTTDFAWLDAVAALAERWPAIFTDERAQRAHAALRDLGEERAVARWLNRTISFWPPTALEHFIEAAHSLTSAALRVEVLSSLICQRGDWPLDAVLRVIADTHDDFHRSVLLGQLATASEAGDDGLLGEAMTSARAAGGWRRYVDALVGMSVNRVCAPVLDELLSAFQKRPSAVLPALAAVAPVLTAEQVMLVLDALHGTGNAVGHTERAGLLLDLAMGIALDDRSVLLDHVARLSERVASDLLPELATVFTEDEAADRILGLAQAMRSDSFRMQTLIDLLPCLNAVRRRRVLGDLAAMVSRHERFRRLLRLAVGDHARALGETDYGDALIALLNEHSGGAPPPSEPEPKIVSVATIDAMLAGLLTECAAVGPSLPFDPSIARARPASELRIAPLLVRLQRCPTEADRFQDIERSFSLLSDTARVELIIQMPQFLNEAHQAAILSHLAPPLPPALQRAACEAAARIESVDSQRRAWRAVLPALDPELFPLLHAVWTEVLQSGSEAHRGVFFERLPAYGPLMQFRGGDAALLEAIRAVDDAARIWA